MFRAGSLVMLASLSLVAISTRVQAEPAFTYSSQNRHVEAYSLSGYRSDSEYCMYYREDNPGEECPRSVETDYQAANDFDLFDAVASADVGGIVHLRQASTLASDRIHVAVSLDAESTCWGPGSQDRICSGYGSSSTTVEFRIDSLSVVRFTGEVVSRNYDSYEIWDNDVTLSLAELGGAVLFDTTDETHMGEYHVDRYDQTYELSPGIYQFRVYVLGEALPDALYLGPGRLDVVSDLVLESVFVPEPPPSTLAVVACAFAAGAFVVRRYSDRLRSA